MQTLHLSHLLLSLKLVFGDKGTSLLKCFMWHIREAGLGKLENGENKAGKQSLGGGVMSIKIHYVDDVHAFVILWL